MKYLPTQYKNLHVGQTFLFKSATKGGSLSRLGKLIYVFTKLKKNTDDKGNIVDKELVGDRVGFEPLEEDHLTTEWYTGQKLQVHSIHICCGVFEIHKVSK